MFMKLEDASVVEAQPFPYCVTSLHCRIKRADPSLIAMHQLSVNVYEQISVSLVEFLKHLNYLIQRPLPAHRKTLISMAGNSLCDAFNAADTHKAARSIHSNADRSHAIGPELRLMLGDMVGMRS